MIYQTVALNYVRIVNPFLYEHASQFDVPPQHWCCGVPRASETSADNWTVVRDGKLTLPLENVYKALERRTYRN
jgi:hypothetical protein